MYGEIFAEEGQLKEFCGNEPNSFLFSFIINEQLIRKNGKLYNIDGPQSIDLCPRDEWVTVNTPYLTGEGKTITRSECMKYSEREMHHRNIFASEEDEPFTDGAVITIDVKVLLEHKDLFSD